MNNVIMLVALTMFIPGFKQAEESSTTKLKQISLKIIKLVNEHRVSQGLPPLIEDEICSSVATEHSINMATGITKFGHKGFDARTEAISIALSLKKIGENVAFGQPSPEEVMKSWINSKSHRANIEGDFTHIGVGTAEDSGGTKYFTQIFIKL